MDDDREFFNVSHKGLASLDSDKYPQGGEKELDFKPEDKVSDVQEVDTTLIDENGNILKRNPTTTIRTAASDVGVLDTAEPLVSKEEISGSENVLTERALSSYSAKENVCTSLEQQIPATSSSQGIIPEGQNNSPETETCQEISNSVLKCKYT